MQITSRRFFAIALAAGAALACAGCCPTTSGPTGPAVRYSATLAPGELRYYDVDVPKGTTQINLQFLLDSLTVPLRLRELDPSCLPASDDTCENLYDSRISPRPAGVNSFGATVPPRGTRIRIVVQNLSADETVNYSVTITPHQAGCT